MENRKKEIAKFYKQIFADEKLKEKLEEKTKAIVNEEDLRKLIQQEIMPLIKKFKLNFSEKDLINYEKEAIKVLSEKDLKDVSGGSVSVKSLMAPGLMAVMLMGVSAAAPQSHAMFNKVDDRPQASFFTRFAQYIRSFFSDDNEDIMQEAREIVEESSQNNNNNNVNNVQQPNDISASNIIATDFNGLQYNYEIIDQSKMKVLISPVADLETWIIPSKVTIAGDEYNVAGTLEQDINVENVIFSEGIKEFNLKSYSGSNGRAAYLGKNNSIIVGSNAFEHFKNLKSVEFDSNIKNLVFEWRACYNCKDLVKINLPDLETLFIGENTFGNCTSLKEFSTPETLNMGKATTSLDNDKRFVISEGAFANCKSLENVKILGQMTGIDIETTAFSNCTSLKDFEILAHVTGTPRYEKNKAYFVGSLKIGDLAFYGCSNLVKFTIPENETITGINIGRSAFKSTSLKKYSIPNTVHSLTIDKNAFSLCKALEEFTVLGDLECGNIFERAFDECSSLKEVSFGKIYNFGIHNNVFKNCKNLKTVHFNMLGNESLIEEDAFAGCKSLEKIIIPVDESDNEIDENIGVGYEIKYL